MNKICIIIALCLGLSISADAQEVYNSSGSRRVTPKKKEQPKGFDPQRIIFGGGLGLSFGDVTAISIAPMVGYRITDNLAAGIGLGYQYLRIKDFFELRDANGNPPQYYDYKTSIYSGSVWARYLVFTNFFAHAEYEQNFMSFTRPEFDHNGSGSIEEYKINYRSPAMLLGAGYRQPVTDNSSFVVMALYDVIQDEYSPYYDRIDVRFGFNVGL
jgi:hypothetical protein